MTEETRLLDAILADPDNDAPRLAFAEFLVGRGDPLGEFIRVQCQLACLADDDAEYAGLKRREEQMLQTQRALLLGPLARYGFDVRFERGLVASVTASAAAFLDNAEGLFRLAPVQEVCLKEARGLLARLARCPQMHGVRRLFLTFNALGAADVRALAESRYLGQLTTLNLGHNDRGDDSLVAIARSTALPRLRHLWLARNDIGDDGLVALARSPLLAQLRTLRLNGNPVGDLGMQALAVSPHAAKLEGLHIGGTRCSDTGALALAGSPHLGRLRWIVVKKCTMGAEGEAALRKRFGDGFNREALA